MIMSSPWNLVVIEGHLQPKLLPDSDNCNLGFVSVISGRQNLELKLS